MKQGRFYRASALALSLYSLSGCAVEESPGGSDDQPIVGDWGDETKYPEIGGAYHSLVPVAGTVTFVNGTLTIPSAVTEVIVVGKRSIDSAILVNGVATGATSTTMKKLVVAGAANDQTVILDFLGGVFGAGTASARGIEINLGAGTNALRIRGSSAGDTFAVGTDGIATNSDNYRDIDVTWTSVGSMGFALAAGNDSLVATLGGKGVTGSAPSTLPLEVYGGDGNDVLTGGDGNDALFGGNGNDTLFGGGVAASGINTLSGEMGADTILQGADSNGQDKIHCGTESPIVVESPVVDTVSYASRGTATPRPTAPAALADITAADGESVSVTLAVSCAGQLKASAPGCSACTDNLTGLAANAVGPADLSCDAVGAYGLVEYPALSGDENETGGSVVGGVWTGSTKAVAELDAVATDCEVIIGTMDNDTLTGDVGANTLSGGGGNDFLTGNAGDDVLNGDADDDTFNEVDTTVGGGADVFNGGAGTDTVTYANRSVALTVTMDGAEEDDGAGEGDDVNADIENLIGGTAGDTITGNNAANVITGGLGADVISGGTGDDTFNEGAVMSDGDTFNGGAGEDTVNYSARTGALVITMGDDTANDGDSAGAGEKDDIKDDVENCNGGAGVDSITGNELNNKINGGITAVNTLLSGLGGDDTLDGEAGTATTVNGGDGGGDICLGGVNAQSYLLCEIKP